MITDYVIELLAHLPAGGRWQRRIATEVEDHLWCSAAQLHADGLGPEEAEREAVRRFGDAAELARALARTHAVAAGRGLARRAALLAGLITLTSLPSGSVATDGFPIGIVTFVLAQVAVVAAGLAVLHGWCARANSEGDPRSLVLLRRAGAVELGCGIAMTLSVLLAILTGVSGWAAAIELGLLIGLCAATAGSLRDLALPTPLVCAAREAGLPGDLLGDLAHASDLTLLWVERRSAPAAQRARHALSVVAAASRRWPRLASYLDLRAHPWRFASLASVAAGLAVTAGRTAGEGLPSGPHLATGLLVSALIVTVEALAALAGFLILGRYLGIRPARADETHES